jgi:YHS domain-containing protein
MQLSKGTIRRVACVAIAVAALSMLVVFAGDKAEAVNKKSGAAIKEYDAVAYFTEGKAVKGRVGFQYEWMGAKWCFASAANRDAFAGNPEKYAPQFGGYCAWAVSNNYVYDADPEVWKIVEGRLYLNYNKSAQRMWEQNLQARIKKGHENWPGLHK